MGTQTEGRPNVSKDKPLSARNKFTKEQRKQLYLKRIEESKNKEIEVEKIKLSNDDPVVRFVNKVRSATN